MTSANDDNQAARRPKARPRARAGDAAAAGDTARTGDAARTADNAAGAAGTPRRRPRAAGSGRKPASGSAETRDALREVLGRADRPVVAASRQGRTSRARVGGNGAAGDGTDAPVVEAPDDEQASTDALVRDVVMAGLAAGSTRDAGPGGAVHYGAGQPGRPERDDGPESDGGPEPDADSQARALRQAGGAIREVDHDTLIEMPSVGAPRGTNVLQALGVLLNSFVTEAGEMTSLAGAVVKSGVTRPKGYWGEVRDVMYDAIKLCTIPMIISVTAFGFGAPGLQGGNLLYLFGVPDRLGGFFMFASIREFAPWIDAMVIAGVVGTAITADLGARRIREEIDAMEVLGVDPVRNLVLPRVIGVGLITGFFDIFALLFGVVGGYFASVTFLGSTSSGFVASFFTEANITDDWASLVKTFLFGAIVGIVCCYKGLRAKGGPAGVGRAVNQAVVISFALIWIVNYAFTNIMLGFTPSTQVIK